MARRSEFRWLFAVLAVGFGAAALFHAVAIAVPTIAEPSPGWRHALFVVINGGVAALFLRRPLWFVPVFIALSLQQLYSHGVQGWKVWSLEQRVDWASLLVVLVLPWLAVLLVVDAWKTRR